MDIKEAIELLVNKGNLNFDAMTDVMKQIMQGHASNAKIASFLTALRMKGETIEEVTAAVNVMQSLALHCPIDDLPVIDIVGTGGDKAHTFNISTTTALVVAAAGGVIAKHGNRSVSSVCGSADVLEKAGVKIELTPEQVALCIRKINIGFMFAPLYHSAMRHALETRKEIGIRTLFNILGPLSNPARAKHHLIGVYHRDWVLPIAEVLRKCGSTRAMVVHADDGLDEISINAHTYVAELKNGEINSYTLNPQQFGLERKALETIQVDSVQKSLDMMKSVLANQPGPARDIVVFNAGAALYVGDLSINLQQGIKMAAKVIAEGKAEEKLQQLISTTEELSHGST